MHIVLVPGLWLAGSSWGSVVAHLEAAGHVAHALTLPGMESVDADRSQTGLAEHVAAVVATVDDIEPGEGRVVLVGHSASASIVHMAADARPERIARLIHVGGFPGEDGEAFVGGFEPEGDDLPLPDWSVFDDADLTDLDQGLREAFRAGAVPSPARLTTDTVRLQDDARLAIPTTLVAPEYTSAMLVDWIEGGHLPEVARLEHVELVDLPTGHWPQLTRPADLARIIAERTEDRHVDEFRRVHPPITAGESLAALGFLDYQRDTLAWKTRGLDAEGLRTTTAASSLTLGGLLKHMAFVEDHWFNHWLTGRDRAAPWNSVDWKATRDWDFDSAADDPPEELHALWMTSVRRSQAAIAAAMAQDGFDTAAVREWSEGGRPTLRWIVLHMIEEYARHNGHADLLREAVDGEVGE